MRSQPIARVRRSAVLLNGWSSQRYHLEVVRAWQPCEQVLSLFHETLLWLAPHARPGRPTPHPVRVRESCRSSRSQISNSSWIASKPRCEEWVNGSCIPLPLMGTIQGGRMVGGCRVLNPNILNTNTVQITRYEFKHLFSPSHESFM